MKLADQLMLVKLILASKPDDIEARHLPSVADMLTVIQAMVDAGPTFSSDELLVPFLCQYSANHAKRVANEG